LNDFYDFFEFLYGFLDYNEYLWKRRWTINGNLHQIIERYWEIPRMEWKSLKFLL